MTFAIGRRAALGLLAAGAAAPAVRAQTVGRTSRIVIGFPPGGSSDVVARLYAEKLRGRYAPQVIVDPRPGAAGRIAVEAVKAAEADGTVILQTPASMLTVQPHVFPREVRYDALTDFIPVSTVCSFPFGFGVPVAHPARTLDQWVAWAKAQGAEVPWASPAAGSVPHFTGIMLGRKLGLRLTHVPYRGGAPAVQDVIAGRLPLFIGVLSEMLPHHNSGLRIIAVTSERRFAKLPDVPTLAELGHPERSAEEWFGALVPANTPAATVAGLHAAIRTAAADPELVAALDRLEFLPTVSATPADFAARIRAERDAWRTVVRESGFTPET
jgi:tripartite-type tricarboxylate transporter receptor subunit TctC